MSQAAYLIIAISILVSLLIIFMVSFVLYKRTPVPKGCEALKINEENCSACQNKDCQYKLNREGEE